MTSTEPSAPLASTREQHDPSEFHLSTPNHPEKPGQPRLGRPRIPVGSIGRISFRTSKHDKVVATARYRDWSNRLRKVSASGVDSMAAECALKSKLARQGLVQSGFSSLSSDSTFGALAEYWLNDLKYEERLSPGTIAAYAASVRTLVLPAFEDLPLHEIGVARCDFLLKQLGKRSHSRARHARVVLHLAFELAVRHEILSRNPIDHVTRLRKPLKQPRALTPAEINTIRSAIRAWQNRPGRLGPKPDDQLGQIIEVMLGTSARIGETLALRRRDVDLTVTPPTVYIAGTIVCHPSQAVSRQDHPKTATAQRVIALPSFAVCAIRQRLIAVSDSSPDALIFSTRNGTPLMPNNVRRQLRSAMELAGLEGVTPHSFRRSAATTICREAGVQLSAELLGHSDPSTTINHYVQREEKVNAITADILARSFTEHHGTSRRK